MTFEDAPYYFPPYDQEQQEQEPYDQGPDALLFRDYAERIHAIASEISHTRVSDAECAVMYGPAPAMQSAHLPFGRPGSSHFRAQLGGGTPVPQSAPAVPVPVVPVEVAAVSPPVRRREEKAQGSPSGCPVAFRLF